MPELPEVETIVRKLNTVLAGKQISQVELRHVKTFSGAAQDVMAVSIQSVSRKGKIIRVQLSNQQNLLIHLKMTGQLIYVNGEQRIGGGHPTPDWVNALPSKHTRVVFSFATGDQLFFNDQRLFGWIKVISDEAANQLFTNSAPDVIDEAMTAEYLAAKFKNRNQNIKQLIMDTSIMGGVGNIYACDGLNLAKLSPFRAAKSLSTTEVEQLVTALKTVIQQGIELGGTTFDGKYVDVDGLAGQYQSVVRVYGREGKPCLNCGHPILKEKLGGRGTYYCAVCQI